MDFDSWDRRGVDAVRVKRLLIGYIVGAVSVSAGMAFVFLTSKGATAVEEEDPAIEAQLVREPEPEPEPEPVPVEQEKPKPRPPKVVTPIEVPQEAPKEAAATGPLPEDEDPFGEEEQPASPTPAVVEAPKQPPPKPVEPVKPRGPIRVKENVVAPVPILQAQPELPASAKAAGIDGVVTVKYVVSETGQVTEAKVLRGPPELHAVCLAAVKTWRFKPALLDGKPISVVRMFRFRFRIKT